MPENLPPNPDHYLVSASGCLGNPPLSSVTQVKLILSKAAQAAPENGLVIHFHGGLVARPYALENIVSPLTQKYREAKAYPLFFVWESGFTETLRNNKTDLLKDPAFRELVKKVSEWVLKKVSIDGALTFKGAGGQPIEDIDTFRREYDKWFDDNRSAPPSEETSIAVDAGVATRAKAGVMDEDELAQDIQNGLDDDEPFKKALTEAYNAANPAAEVATKGVGTKKRADKLLLSEDALDEMFPPAEDAEAGADAKVNSRGVFSWFMVAKFVAKLVIAVVKRFRSDRDHGVYCSVVEEVLRSAYGNLIGAAIWNQMKKDTLDSFADAADTCGWAVVNELKALESAGKSFKKLTLVGHSTGAVYICNFLDMAKRVGLSSPTKVVFLAPAVTCERFAQAIDAHGSTGLKDFRMFAMRDEREIEDKMLKPLYTRSLLYFVSGLLEGNAVEGGWSSVLDTPLVGMERFQKMAVFSDDAAVQKVVKFLKGSANRMVWSPAAGQGLGLNSDSRRHGDFDNDPTTVQSVKEDIAA